MKLSLISTLLIIFSVAYQQETVLGQKVQLDQVFRIKIGHETLIDKLKIKLDSVPEDNRCPCEEECSSRHNAVVLLRLGSPQSEGKYVVLNTDSESKEVLARGYKISLIRLDPCRESYHGRINPDEYEATLLVTKSQAATGNANGKSQRESTPNFNGNWQRGEALDAGTTLTISHRRSELSVTHSRSAMARKSITKNIYYIDGRAHITTRTEYYEDSSTIQKHRYKMSKVRSVVKWDGDKLVIVDDNGQSEWELSESGRELILSNEKKRMVYKRVS